METRTLILTRSEIPHQIKNWREAVGMLFTDPVQVLRHYEGKENEVAVIPETRVFDFPNLMDVYPSYGGGELIIYVPAVLKLTEYDGSVKRGIKFSRINVYTRDGFRCCYCGHRFPTADLNYDHVVPRQSGGRTNWENIVTSCYPCNRKKANRTPEQAGMRLRKKPYKPKSLPMMGLRFDADRVHPTWETYCKSWLGDGAAA